MNHLVLVLVLAALSAAAAADHIPGANYTVWPMPRRLRPGKAALTVDAAQFTFVAGPGSGSAPLSAAFGRYRAICFPHAGSSTDGSTGGGAVLRSMTVRVASPAAALAFGADESYNLTLPGGASGGGGTIEAATIFGAYHALETFAQLLRFDFDARRYIIEKGAALRIEDAPRFGWRELMVDTSRHFLPLRVLRQVVDSLTTAKLNVLHLHLVDAQAFPLVLPSRPLLAKGAYSAQERYTLADLGDLQVRTMLLLLLVLLLLMLLLLVLLLLLLLTSFHLQVYAEARGVRLVAEIDTPGHAASWCVGMPQVRIYMYKDPCCELLK